MNLRAIREAKGLSQIELATKVDVRQSAVSQWETEASTPTYANIIKLTQELDCTPTELLAPNEYAQ